MDRNHAAGDPEAQYPASIELKICDCLFPINTLYYGKSQNDAPHRRYGEIAKW